MIKDLEQNDPSLYRTFSEELRKHDGIAHFIGNSGRYPFCGRGRINTYAVFAELNRTLINFIGRVGCIVPSGIATDDTTKFFFQDLIARSSLVSLYDFENRDCIFIGVHRSYKFCLLTLTGSGKPNQRGAEFLFFAHQTTDLGDPERRFVLTADDIALLNPNTRTCPIFRSRRCRADLHIYRRVQVLIDEPRRGNPWGISFKQGLFNIPAIPIFSRAQELEKAGWQCRGMFSSAARSVICPFMKPR